MKAIETRYNGHRFRSRTEARWAVFLNEAGVEWRYEHEGYQLTDGRPYLPDFFLPDIYVHLEIKPTRDVFSVQEAMGLCETFDHDAPLVVFWGLPGEHPGAALLTDTCDSGGGYAWYDHIRWADRRQGSPDLVLDIGDPRIKRDRTIWCGYENYERPHPTFNLADGDTNDGLLAACFDLAKAARFEHGQSGAF